MTGNDPESETIVVQAKEELVAWAKTRFTTLALLIGVISLFGVGALVNSAVQLTLQSRLDNVIQSSEDRLKTLEQRFLDMLLDTKESAAETLAEAKYSEKLAGDALNQADSAKNNLTSLEGDILDLKERYQELVDYAQNASDISYSETKFINQAVRTRDDYLSYIELAIDKMREAIEGINGKTLEHAAIEKLLSEINLSKQSFDAAKQIVSENGKFKVVVYRQSEMSKDRELFAEHMVDAFVFDGFQAELWKTTASSRPEAISEMTAEFGVDSKIIGLGDVGILHHPAEPAVGPRIAQAIGNIENSIVGQSDVKIAEAEMKIGNQDLGLMPRKYEYQDYYYFPQDSIILVWVLEKQGGTDTAEGTPQEGDQTATD